MVQIPLVNHFAKMKIKFYFWILELIFYRTRWIYFKNEISNYLIQIYVTFTNEISKFNQTKNSWKTLLIIDYTTDNDFSMITNENISSVTRAKEKKFRKNKLKTKMKMEINLYREPTYWESSYLNHNLLIWLIQSVFGEFVNFFYSNCVFLVKIYRFPFLSVTIVTLT